MIFELDNVELSYAEKKILSGVYMKAETGKICGILGKNGTGKSSLLQIFFGSLSPSNKLIRVDRVPYLQPFFKSEKVKYLPQSELLPRNLKLSKAFKLYEINWESFISYFPTFDKHKNTVINNFSGGEVRVVETFLILKSKADLILLDEAFSHLAPVYVEIFKEILIKEKKKKAIVLTDHMYRHILDLADDLYLLKNGCTQLLDDPKQLEDYKYLNPGTI